MDELIARITATLDIDEQTARRAVPVIFGFLAEEGPPERVRELAARVPGAGAYLAEAKSGSRGLMGALGGMVGGGGAMAALGALSDLGLDLEQVQQIASTFIAFARERIGEEGVDEILASIPVLARLA